MVITDHVCHVILKRKSAPWGSFRTPRRERLMADVAILSMLHESTAIVSVNSDLYLYQFIYLQNIPLLKLLQKFAVHTSVALVTEVFFTGASLAIETHQNIAVMAVWKKEKGKRKKWKKIGKMEKTHFGCYSKSRSIGNLDDTPPLGNCTWALL